jgi:probable F420-dependent oxidoreductase
MKVGILLPIDYGFSVAEHLEFTRLAEEGGLDSVFAGEVAGFDPFVLLAAIGSRTDRIRLGTAIASIYARPPAAMTASILALASAIGPERLVAGIGVSSPVIVEQWHGLTYDRPVTRAKEYIRLLRAMLAGEQSDFAGTTLRSRGFRAGVAPASVPLYLGAFGPRMFQLAATEADGVITGLVRPDQMPAAIQQLTAHSGFRSSDLPPLKILATGLRVYCGSQVERARRHLRRLLLGYAMVATHRTLFERHVPELDEVERLWQAGERAAALTRFGDDAVDAFCVVGTADQVMRRIQEFAETGVDELLVQPVGYDAHDVEGCREAVSAVCCAVADQTPATA